MPTEWMGWPTVRVSFEERQRQLMKARRTDRRRARRAKRSSQ